ncbi:MAG TPA: hypothetical protein VMX96_04340 [Dehalococcoidia bacterium]|nr:hypothetical protein [Dehalococcoidia bacterium]
MDLSIMVTQVRRDLRDEDSENYNWTDDELKRHIAHALYDLSEQIPRETTVTLSTVSGSMDLDIASLSDRVVVHAVEYPLDCTPRRYQRFSLWGDTLTFLLDLSGPIPDGSDCTIYYGKIHTLNGSATTLPTKYHDLLAMGSEGYALISWGGYSVNRVNLGGPDVSADYRHSGDLKLDLFYSQIKRLGRRHRALVSRLYTPAEAPVSMSE